MPIDIATISGNGTYTQFRTLFEHKCGVEYVWSTWIVEEVGLVTGYELAKEEWRKGGALGKAAAIGILVANLVVLSILLIALYCLGRCIRQGKCYRPMTESDDGAGLRARAADILSDTHTDAMARAEAEMEMNDLPDRSE